MKQQRIYMCKNGHLHYGDEPPEKCKHCGETDFGLITADMDQNEEPRDYKYS